VGLHQSLNGFRNPRVNRSTVFFWLLIQDKLSTRNILRRKNMYLPSYSCVLCSLNNEETTNQLFFECNLARDCWGLSGLTVISSLDPLQRFESFRMHIDSRFFIEIIIIMCWSHHYHVLEHLDCKKWCNLLEEFLLAACTTCSGRLTALTTSIGSTSPPRCPSWEAPTPSAPRDSSTPTARSADSEFFEVQGETKIWGPLYTYM